MELCLKSVFFLQYIFYSSLTAQPIIRPRSCNIPFVNGDTEDMAKLLGICSFSVLEPSLITSKPKFSWGQSVEGWAHQTTARWPVLLLSEGAVISQPCWKLGVYHSPTVPQELMVEQAAGTQRKFDCALGRTKGNWEQVKFEWWGERYLESPTVFFSRMEFCHCLSFHQQVWDAGRANFTRFVQFFSSCWRQKEKRRQDRYAEFGDVVRGHKVRIPNFSQASGKCQGNSCEYLLASLTLVLLQIPPPIPSSGQALPHFTATVPLPRGWSGAWEGLVYFGYFP